ncbi:hypothetical protein C8J57DRAFT_1364140 [Mycena rebaudengoi]|nr:hypothetical protein C8J57DRAFT_1364140 [Mycena rebaudengoi]
MRRGADERRAESKGNVRIFGSSRPPRHRWTSSQRFSSRRRAHYMVACFFLDSFFFPGRPFFLFRFTCPFPGSLSSLPIYRCFLYRLLLRYSAVFLPSVYVSTVNLTSRGEVISLYFQFRT